MKGLHMDLWNICPENCYVKYQLWEISNTCLVPEDLSDHSMHCQVPRRAHRSLGFEVHGKEPISKQIECITWPLPRGSHKTDELAKTKYNTTFVTLHPAFLPPEPRCINSKFSTPRGQNDKRFPVSGLTARRMFFEMLAPVFHTSPKGVRYPIEEPKRNFTLKSIRGRAYLKD